MMKLYGLTIFLLSVNSVLSFKRVCYYTNWSQSRPLGGRFTPEDIDPYLCTHIIFAYARIVGDEILPTEWNDENTQLANGQYEKVTSLKSINPDLRVILGVNGWNTVSLLADWPTAASFRSKFILSTIAFLRRRNFDGIDLNWALPTAQRVRPVKREIFTHLLQELREGFDEEAKASGSDPLLLTAAVSAERHEIDSRYDVPELSRLLDFINVMSFDLQGPRQSTLEHHSPLYPRANQIGDERYRNVDEAMTHWLNLGAPSSKLLVGIPFYGRTYTLLSAHLTNMGDPDEGIGPAGPYTQEKGFMSYYEVCELLNRGATTRWHTQHQVPYIVNGTSWVAYEDGESITEKIKWLKAKHFGGAAVWALDLDDFWGDFCNRGPYPLLQTVHDQLTAADSTTKSIGIAISNTLLNDQLMYETVQEPATQIKVQDESKVEEVKKPTDPTQLENKNVMRDPLPTEEQLALNGTITTNTSKYLQEMIISAENNQTVNQILNHPGKQNNSVKSASKAYINNDTEPTNLERTKNDSVGNTRIRNKIDNQKDQYNLDISESKQNVNKIVPEVVVRLNEIRASNLAGSETRFEGSQTVKTTSKTSVGTTSSRKLSTMSEILTVQKPVKKYILEEKMENTETKGNPSQRTGIKTDKGTLNVDYHDRKALNKNTLLHNIRSLSIPSDDALKDLNKPKQVDSVTSEESLGNHNKHNVEKKFNDQISKSTNPVRLSPLVPPTDILTDFVSQNGPNKTRGSTTTAYGEQLKKSSIEKERTSIESKLKSQVSKLDFDEQTVFNNSKPSIYNESNNNMNLAADQTKLKPEKDSQIDLAAAEWHVYDISPSIIDATPKKMSLNERKSYAEKVKSQQDETDGKKPKPILEGFTLHKSQSSDKGRESLRRNNMSSLFSEKSTGLKNSQQILSSNIRDTHTIKSDLRKSTALATNKIIRQKNMTVSNKNTSVFEKSQSSSPGKRKTFSIERFEPKYSDQTYSTNQLNFQSGTGEHMFGTNEFGVPYSVLCKYNYVLCFDHINKVFIHGKNWDTLQAVYVKPENITTTPDPSEIIIHHPNEVK